MKKKIYNKQCSKKQLTLSEVKAMAQKPDAPKKDEGTSVGATATITTSEEVHNAEFFDVMKNVNL